MNKIFLKNMEKLIKERHYKSTYLHNEYIGFGTSNIDEIEVDYDAFFNSYENLKTNNDNIQHLENECNFEEDKEEIQKKIKKIV